MRASLIKLVSNLWGHPVGESGGGERAEKERCDQPRMSVFGAHCERFSGRTERDVSVRNRPTSGLSTACSKFLRNVRGMSS
jgi:hypothetical protein